MRKTSIQASYYFTLICHIFTLICGIVCSIIILMKSNKFVDLLGLTVGLIFVLIAAVAFICLIIASIRQLIVLFKDYKSLKQKQFCSITGKIMRFNRNRDPETGLQINDEPLVKSLDGNEEIILKINDKVLLGEIYRFNYLSNSKIAEVIEKINQ